MTSAPIVPLAQALAKALKGATLTQPVEVAFAFLPEYAPSELKVPTITVVPKARQSELAARVDLDHHLQVDLGIQKKLTSEPGELEKLMALVDQIDDFVREAELEGAGEMAWICSANNPIYSVDHLRKGVFTSVLTVTYRVVT